MLRDIAISGSVLTGRACVRFAFCIHVSVTKSEGCTKNRSSVPVVDIAVDNA